MPTALLAIALAASAERPVQPRITFTKDIAPIIFEQCASCHRPGEIAPFSLLAYEDVRPRASAIARATRSRSMPPWPPEPGVAFVGARRLTEQQIETIEQWVKTGAIEGHRSDLPPPPAFADGWRLGQPDLVVALTEPYRLPAGGPDVLRNFVIAIPGNETRYVRGIEFRPGNARVVHHANLRVDRTRASRRQDEADPQPGYDGRITTGNFPDGHFLGWTPGQVPPLSEPGMAWRLDPGSDLVVQLHMHPVETAQIVQPAIGFFLSTEAPTRTPMMLRLGRQNIDIAPGVRDYLIEDSYVLPVGVDVYGVQPHAHHRARHIEGSATLPDGTRRSLIEIKDWDFNWQDVYRYTRPFPLPKGTVLRMRYTYDNSAGNRRNPDRPPRRVRWGQNSADEMGDLWIQVLPRTDQDRKLLVADFGPKALAEDAAGYEKVLEADPSNARLHEAVAAIYLSLERTEKGIEHLRIAIRIDPESAEAHYNLATALVWQRRLDEAVAHFHHALRIEPDHVGAHVNLGTVLRRRGDLDEAAAHLRRALELQPANASAHTNLAGIFAAERRDAEAIAEHRLALRANPDALESLTDLAWMLSTSSDASIRAPADAITLAERAAALTNRKEVRVLDTLAAAYAADGRFEDAVTTVRAAIDLADRAGAHQDAEQLRSRLALYRQGQPFRELR